MMAHLLDQSVPEIVAEWYRLMPELEGVFAGVDKRIANQEPRLEMPTGDEPQWPHPDSFAAKLLRHVTAKEQRAETANKEVAQPEAKIKELREWLRQIEWVDVPSGYWCPSCKTEDDMPHRDDCWLKAEIDQLEEG